MTKQELSLDNLEGPKQKKSFEGKGETVNALQQSALGAFILCLGLLGAFDVVSDPGIAALCFVIFCVFGGLALLSAGIRSFLPKYLVITGTLVRYYGPRSRITGKPTLISWEHVTRLRNHCTTYRSGPIWFIDIETDQEKLTLRSSVEFSKNILKPMFKAMAGMKEYYPDIEIQDDCNWL